jgi:RNA polymerase sigma factor (sigma-70 family)
VGRGATVLDPPVAAVLDAPEGGTDHELVAAVRRGDDRAFERLYSRYQRRISAYVFGMVKDYGRAEDITQEVFISALRRMRETERPITFKPWVYEIAKNACIDQFRRSRRTEEVSFDAGDGLAGADQGRLIASEPTPDAAVDAKQQLDHLCGAFGGLSDSHHEILVLREFEGLSYREIGDRMGLSRPGVESTLFRARKRLGEEYDELVSGQRCIRIQSIIASAETATPGARDTRRLARHLSHCQPCRRQAVASGLDAALLARKPVRKRIAERAAAFLPLPGFLRTRLWAGGDQFVPVSEPVATAWSKAVVAAATLLVAGVGAGVAPHPGGGSTSPLRDNAKPAAAVKSSPASSRAGRTHRPLGTTAPAAPARKAKGHAGSRHRATLGTPVKTSQPGGTGAPRSSAPAGNGGGSGSHASAPSKPAATNPGVSAPKPSHAPVSTPGGTGVGGGGAAGGGVHLPSIPQIPAIPPVAGNRAGGQVGDAVNQAASTVTNTVNGATNTVNAVTDTVNGATGSVTGSLPKLGG